MGYTNGKGKFAAGNPGRPPGAKDKTSRKAKATALAFIQEYFTSGQAVKDWKAMQPAERWTVICRLLSIVTPREANTKINLQGLEPAQAALVALKAAEILEDNEEDE